MNDLNIYDEIPFSNINSNVYMLFVSEYIEKYELLSQNDFYTFKMEFKYLTKELHKSLENMTKLLNILQPIPYFLLNKTFQHLQVKDINVISKKLPFSNQNLKANYIYQTINENLLEYIASNDPDYESVSDFLQMIWECKITLIVRIKELYETQNDTCEYWPPNLESNNYCNQSSCYKIKTQNESISNNIIIRKLLIQNVKYEETRIIAQIEISIDTKLNENTASTFDSLLLEIQEVKSIKDRSHRILFHARENNLHHCAVLICLDQIITSVEAGISEFNVYETVLRICQSRSMLIKNENQYINIYQSVYRFLKSKFSTLQSA